MNPLVSIIVPTYNRAHYLPEALHCALEQTYPNIEVVVINDGSTDNTEEVLEPYLNRVRYIKKHNSGCAAAKNTGLEHAKGEFLTNLDDDDRIHPEKIERQVKFMVDSPQMGVCGTGVNFIDGEGNITRQYQPPRFTRESQVLQLLRRCYLVQSSVMIRRECHEKLGNYTTMFSEDYEFWLRVAPHYDIGMLNEYLTDYRCHGNQMTGPATHGRLLQDLRFHVREFVKRTPIEHIIPGVCSYPEAHVLMGIIMAEQKIDSLAESYFQQALPHASAHLGQGLLHLQCFEYEQAAACFDMAYAAEPLLSERVEAAQRLVKQVKSVMEQSDIHNKSPEVRGLRKGLSQYRSNVIKELYYASRGEYDFVRACRA